MRMPPPTILLYCTGRDCIHNKGIEVRWIPDSFESPGYPASDSCPRCRNDLTDTPPEAQEEAA
jgi:hypothetical protein